MTDKATIRALDITFAALGLIVLGIPILICGMLVKRDSPGPAFFRQTRVGRREKPFTCIKLRTMTVDAPSVGTHEVCASLVTPLGRVLRHYKLDELPQLWNVLRGEMSLVGPRPGLPLQTQLVEERRLRSVFDVRPGVTGPGQVAGVDMSEPRRLSEIDQEWSRDPRVFRYFELIGLTLLGGGRGDRVLD